MTNAGIARGAHRIDNYLIETWIFARQDENKRSAR